MPKRTLRFDWATLAAAAAVAACTGKPKAPDPSDPNAPAVVKVPKVVLPSDTAKPDTMPAYIDRRETVRRTIPAEYAVLAAAITVADRETITSFYTSNATMRLGKSEVPGPQEIARVLADFGTRNSVKELNRTSRLLEGRNGAFVDSGEFVVIAQRTGGQRRVSQGTYRTEWIFDPVTSHWRVRRDELSDLTPVAARR